MCNKCENFHSKLLQKHQIFNLEKENEEIFTGICFEEDHQDKLEYFCKTHNVLCCPACIAKIEKNKYGTHKDCNVCIIEEIIDEKKNKIKENIKYLEDISNNLEESLKIIKNIVETIKKEKEEIKMKIQKIFTKLRNEVNNREDELLLEVDKKFDNLFFNENIIKESEKLPNKIKLNIEKSKLLENEYDEDNKLSLFINNCINIENNIKDINIINENLKKSKNLVDININFIEENDEELIEILENIKKFGNLDNNFKEIDNPWTNKRFTDYADVFYYTLKENNYLAEKTENNSYIHLIKSSYEFKKDKIYKLEFIPNYNKGGDFYIGFGDFNQTKNKSCLNCLNSVALRNNGLYINNSQVNGNVKIENGKKYEFIIDISKKYFILHIDKNEAGKYQINFKDNIFAHAAIRNIGNSLRIKTYEK